MWIKSCKLQKNIPLPNYVIEHLRRLITELKGELENRLGRSYKIHLDFSVHSEAAYITISKGLNTYKFSIRNHSTRVQNFDKAFYLFNFHSWEEFQTYILKIEVKQIKHILNNEIQSIVN